MSEAQVPEITEHASPFTFDVTLERLVDAIAKSAMTIFARIDHAANARGVGATGSPTTVLIYGMPRAARP